MCKNTLRTLILIGISGPNPLMKDHGLSSKRTQDLVRAMRGMEVGHLDERSTAVSTEELVISGGAASIEWSHRANRTRR